MPIFECRKCGCVENTAVSGYWWKSYKDPSRIALCSECDPEIGKWHGMFEKKKAADCGYWIAEDGFLYHPDEKLSHTKLLRKVV